MENQKSNYQYQTKNNYSVINQKKVSEEKAKHVSKQSSIFYSVDLEWYDENGIYYIIEPKEYLDNIDQLRQNKNDIFAKGKILTFSDRSDFSFAAVVDSSEEDPDDKNIVYAYIVPIKEKYREYSKKILGNYKVEERNGDLTYERMSNAIKEFVKGGCCSNNLEQYILGNNISNGYKEFKKIFNYKTYYLNEIYNFAKMNYNQEKELQKIFHQEISTINLKKNTDNRILCLIIYAIYQCRKNMKDKILVCSSSNSVADSISLDLLRMKEYIDKLDILRIYAKNQELIKRNRRLNKISFHQLRRKRYKKKFNDRYEKRKWIIKKHDIIISTCVNSYNDDIINFKFPFVIIIDANNSNENENLIPITLNAKHVLLISYEGSDNGEINLYKRIKNLYPKNHCEI